MAALFTVSHNHHIWRGNRRTLKAEVYIWPDIPSLSLVILQQIRMNLTNCSTIS